MTNRPLVLATALAILSAVGGNAAAQDALGGSAAVGPMPPPQTGMAIDVLDRRDSGFFLGSESGLVVDAGASLHMGAELNQGDADFYTLLDESRLGVRYRALVGSKLVVLGRVSLGAEYAVAGGASVFPELAYGGVGVVPASWIRLRMRAGLLESPWIEALELGYNARSVHAHASERTGVEAQTLAGLEVGAAVFNDRVRGVLTLADASTQGVRLGGAGPLIGGVPSDLGAANDALELEAVVSGRVFATDVHRGPLFIELHALAVGRVADDGSELDRWGAGLTFVGPCPRAGIEYIDVDPSADGSQHVLGAWANSYFGTHWVGGGFRVDHSRGVTDAGVTQLDAGGFIYSDLFDSAESHQQVRVHLGYTHRATTAQGASASTTESRVEAGVSWELHHLVR